MTKVVLDSGEENDVIPAKESRARVKKAPKPKLGKSLWRILPGVAPALSLRQPWAWAVVYAGKPLENRLAWRGCGYRGPILIHAAAGMKKDEYENAIAFMKERGVARRSYEDLNPHGRSLPIVPPRDQLARGVIVGVARIVGVVERGHAIRGERTPAIDVLTAEERRWWMGGFGLLLAGVTPIRTAIPCAGALGLFTPPASVYNEVLRALATTEVPKGMYAREELPLRPSAASVAASAAKYDPMHYVCEARTCACASSEADGASADECYCADFFREGKLRTRCRKCGKAMRAVDLESGWPIEEVR